MRVFLLADLLDWPLIWALELSLNVIKERRHVWSSLGNGRRWERGFETRAELAAEGSK